MTRFRLRSLVAMELVFVTLFFTRWSLIGTDVVPCDGTLALYCATAAVLGSGPAWLLWHALVSAVVGWCFAALAERS